MKKLLIILMLILAISTVFASDLRINGFISQGFIYSTENDYLVKGSQDGSTEYSEAGFTLQKNIGPKLRVGFQLLARDFGELGNNQVYLDWASADYRWRDYLGFRIGKVKTPMGLYNEGRDIDMLRSSVLLPQSIYDEHYRSYFVGIQGGSLYGNIPMTDFASIDYNAFVGNMNFDRNDLPMKNLYDLTNSILGAIGTSTPYVDMTCNDFFGASGFINLPVGIKLGASFVDFNGEAYTPVIPVLDEVKIMGDLADPNDPTSFVPNGETVNVTSNERFILDVEFPMRYILSLEWQYNNFKFATEYAFEELNVKTDIEIPQNMYLTQPEETFYTNFGVTKIDDLYHRTDISYYFMGSYTFMDKLTFSAMYDYVELDEVKKYSVNPETGEVGFFSTDYQYNDWQDHRQDIGFGFKYDISFNWSIKMEAHTVDGTYKTSSEALEGVISNDLTDKWNYYLGKISFNF